MHLPVDLLLLTTQRIRNSLHGRCKKKIMVSVVCVVLQAFFAPIVSAEVTKPLTVTGAGLNLFIDADQQQQLDQTSIAQELSDLPQDELLVEADDLGVVAEPQIPENVTDTIELAVRYDGIVLKNNRILSVWLDHRQVSGRIESHGIDLTAIDTAGRLLVEAGTLRKQIVPGDYLPIPGDSVLIRLMDETEGQDKKKDVVAENNDAEMVGSKVAKIASVNNETAAAADKGLETDPDRTGSSATDSDTTASETDL